MVHGGDDGEINFGPALGQYVFDCTLAENRAQETLFELPTLRQVFELVNSKLMVNVEIKVPYLAEVKARYNWQAAC